ncbi:MAG: DUF4340 domain-containing protein [Acidobacteria bacterium]|nr:DUF4340 domain-containing protein [Acidobacteriota bacterium]
MKFRGLLVAAALLAVLGGLLYWSNKKQKLADAKGPDAGGSLKLLSIPEDQIKDVKLVRTVDTTVLSKGNDGKWQIAEPKPLPADQDAVNSMVSSLSSLTGDKLVEEKAADISPYGLKPPTLEVEVGLKNGKTDKLMIGDEIPTGGGNYAMVAGDPRVFTIFSSTKTNFDKGSNDLRDKRLLTFDSEKLTRVDLQSGGQTLEFGKNANNDWSILKPRTLRADGSQVEELIRKLKDARMDTLTTAEDAKKAAAAFGSGTRVAVATVSDPNGNQQLEVRRDKDKNYYAKSSVVEGIWKVGSDLGEGLDKKLDDFRNKKIFDFGWSDPTKVEVRNGSNTAAYTKSGDKWMAGSKQMDASSVQALIEKLRDLSAAKFPDTAPAGAAVLDATVSSNDGKRVEKVTLTKAGNSYFAKRDGEPSIYEVDAKAVEDLQKAAGEVKEYQPPKK